MDRRALALALLLVGCGSEAQPAPDPPEPVAPALAPAPAPLDAIVQVASAAAFRDGVLDECIDMEVRLAPHEGMREWPANMPNYAAAVRDRALAASPDATAIPRPCVDQFSDRVALATCSTPIPMGRDAQPAENTEEAEAEPSGPALPADADADGRVVSRYFNSVTVLESDGYMRQCLETGGDWQAADRQGRDVRRARIEQLQRDSRRLQKRLGR